MTNNFLLHNFKHLTSTPANVEQLKKLVLQMAVQGKLTAKWREEVKTRFIASPELAQTPDYNAHALLQKIKTEKEQLIKEGKIKRQKHLPPIADEEKPFELPESWEWERLGNICSKVGSGSTPKGSNYVKEGLPFFRSQNIHNDGLVYDDIKYISKQVQQKMKGTIVKPDDILLNITGGSLGRCAHVPLSFHEGNVSQHVTIIRPILLKNEFLHLQILSPLLQKPIFDFTTGAGREGLPKYNLEKFIVSLPPLAEQQAIVSKVEKIFTQIDQLHALAQKRLNYREKSAKALFSKINHAENDTELQETWQTLTAHFHNLTQSKESVKQLRQSILQMAVQGKLTAKWREENPDLEPASVLLEKVKQDFEKQIQKGILKKKKSPEIIKETDHFFNIPQTYTWCRLSEICNINGGYAFKSTNYTKEGVRVIRISDFDEYGLKGKNIVRHKFINELSPYKLEMKNILMAMTGGTVGKSYYVKALDEDMYVNQRVATIKISELIDSAYIHYSLRIPLIQNIIQEKKKSTNDNISMTDINNFLISLPPLEEQKAIVSKVKQLMAWCDELEKKIEKRDAYQEKMMQAVVKQAFKTEKETVEME